MGTESHVLGELCALLAEQPDVEHLSDTEVGQLLGVACRKYRVTMTEKQALRVLRKAREEIYRRRKAA